MVRVIETGVRAVRAAGPSRQNVVHIDPETIGLDPVVALDEIIEIAVVGPTGETILQSLVRPVAKTTWDEAQAVNGIAPADVADAQATRHVWTWLLERQEERNG